ncbi:hypothetical protein EHM69_06635 [candidate division KSB1 bacterium]|nr:MAG: hypothetical protein EHM69_13295 [candidate division KSB1 bacterium]RPH94697.1 MAG: hypothetical protein EHM69_06635 [candidate division KSB1 bacterium]
MKIVYVGLILLCTLTLACAVTGNSSIDPKAEQAAQQNGQAPDGQISTPAPSSSDQSEAIMTRAEAESLSVQGDSLLAQSDVSEIKVGEIGSGGLIYILVVVLLVVLIISVAR